MSTLYTICAYVAVKYQTDKTYRVLKFQHDVTHDRKNTKLKAKT